MIQLKCTNCGSDLELVSEYDSVNNREPGIYCSDKDCYSPRIFRETETILDFVCHLFELEGVFQKGYKACIEGKELMDNPYHIEHEFYVNYKREFARVWEEGYMQSRKDHLYDEVCKLEEVIADPDFEWESSCKDKCPNPGYQLPSETGCFGWRQYQDKEGSTE